jgi:hypothetical protein
LKPIKISAIHNEQTELIRLFFILKRSILGFINLGFRY